jgi:hypothetical protein
MIFGGLEIVAGGYLLHRHYRKKEKLQEEAQKRRHNTFPGANSAKAHHQPQPQQQQTAVPQQKYTCYAPGNAAVAQPCPPQYQHQTQAQHQPRPQPPAHTQSFKIPRRPVPERKPQIIIEPSLQRADSFATISRMPIANGSRPQDIPEEPSPASPAVNGLSPTHQHGIYGNAGFSMSTPAFGATPTSPGLTYTMATGHEGLHTVDDNWETYGHGRGAGAGGLHYSPTVSTQLGELDPPPPYTP